MLRLCKNEDIGIWKEKYVMRFFHFITENGQYMYMYISDPLMM